MLVVLILLFHCARWAPAQDTATPTPVQDCECSRGARARALFDCTRTSPRRLLPRVRLQMQGFRITSLLVALVALSQCRVIPLMQRLMHVIIKDCQTVSFHAIQCSDGRPSNVGMHRHHVATAQKVAALWLQGRLNSTVQQFQWTNVAVWHSVARGLARLVQYRFNSPIGMRIGSKKNPTLQKAWIVSRDYPVACMWLRVSS